MKSSHLRVYSAVTSPRPSSARTFPRTFVKPRATRGLRVAIPVLDCITSAHPNEFSLALGNHIDRARKSSARSPLPVVGTSSRFVVAWLPRCVTTPLARSAAPTPRAAVTTAGTISSIVSTVRSRARGSARISNVVPTVLRIAIVRLAKNAAKKRCAAGIGALAFAAKGVRLCARRAGRRHR